MSPQPDAARETHSDTSLPCPLTKTLRRTWLWPRPPVSQSLLSPRGEPIGRVKGKASAIHMGRGLVAQMAACGFTRPRVGWKRSPRFRLSAVALGYCMTRRLGEPLPVRVREMRVINTPENSVRRGAGPPAIAVKSPVAVASSAIARARSSQQRPYAVGAGILVVILILGLDGNNLATTRPTAPAANS